ncbi:MAG: SDR family NAD(P)-dependent oxidoreductase [Jiangellaceae bacterium]
MPDNDLAVVVGAGPGLGRAVAMAFASRGLRVVLLARNAGRVAALAHEIAAQTRTKVDSIPADAADEPALRNAFQVIRRRHGDPAVLVHNPSVAVEAPPTLTPLESMIDGLRLAAGSLLVAAQEVAPAMRSAHRGTIIVTGNSAALTGSTWSATLGVQKAAARNLAMSLASELRTDGVHVVTVTIDGVLGTPGFDVDRIAAEYVRLHEVTDGPRTSWRPEIVWRGSPA